MNSSQAFAHALDRIRKIRRRHPRELDTAISPSYRRYIEGGLKSPTLRKVEAVARELEVRPLTLLLATYAGVNPDVPLKEKINEALQELETLEATCKTAIS